jgi:hypothetical protein
VETSSFICDLHLLELMSQNSFVNLEMKLLVSHSFSWSGSLKVKKIFL